VGTVIFPAEVSNSMLLKHALHPSFVARRGKNFSAIFFLGCKTGCLSYETSDPVIVTLSPIFAPAGGLIISI
jgi:hypothetical protein